MTNVAEQFTEEQIQEMKEAFNMFDRNRFVDVYENYVITKRDIISDGTVHNLQLVQLFKILGIHVTEAELKVCLYECLLLYFVMIIRSKSKKTLRTRVHSLIFQNSWLLCQK